MNMTYSLSLIDVKIASTQKNTCLKQESPTTIGPMALQKKKKCADIVQTIWLYKKIVCMDIEPTITNAVNYHRDYQTSSSSLNVS